MWHCQPRERAKNKALQKRIELNREKSMFEENENILNHEDDGTLCNRMETEKREYVELDDFHDVHIIRRITYEHFQAGMFPKMETK